MTRPGFISGALNALYRAEKSFLFSLCKLNQIQFDAPWNPTRPSC